jgi:hypothetical protein
MHRQIDYAPPHCIRHNPQVEQCSTDAARAAAHLEAAKSAQAASVKQTAAHRRRLGKADESVASAGKQPWVCHAGIGSGF